MTCTDDQFRSILRAEAADISAAGIPPLSLPGRDLAGPGRRAGEVGWRGRRWLVPMGAAAAVIAVIATSVALRGGSQPQSTRPERPPSQSQVPPYYMYLPPGQSAAVIRSTATGARVATMLPPKSDRFIVVSAAADDRTFALAAMSRTWSEPRSCNSAQSPACWPPFSLYQARFNPMTGTVISHALPIPVLRASYVAIALSTSGTELAVATATGAGNGNAVKLREYSLTSGNQQKVWQGQGWVSDMAWGANGQLAFEGAGATGSTGIRVLNINTAGGSLVGASRLIVNSQQPGHYALGLGFALSGDGKTIAVAVARTPWRNRTPASEIRWYSVATGGETRAYTPPSAVANELWQVLWSNSSGQVTVLRRTSGDKTDRPGCFDVLTGSKLVAIPLPIPTAQAGFFFGLPITF